MSDKAAKEEKKPPPGEEAKKKGDDKKKKPDDDDDDLSEEDKELQAQMALLVTRSVRACPAPTASTLADAAERIRPHYRPLCLAVPCSSSAALDGLHRGR